jgi:hypothetical protein
VLHWITHNDVQEDFVVKLDGDMVLRKPFIPEEVGALKGAPVGGYYGYLHGVDNGMVRGIRPVSPLALSSVCVRLAACHTQLSGAAARPPGGERPSTAHVRL